MPNENLPNRDFMNEFGRLLNSISVPVSDEKREALISIMTDAIEHVIRRLENDEYLREMEATPGEGWPDKAACIAAHKEPLKLRPIQELIYAEWKRRTPSVPADMSWDRLLLEATQAVLSNSIQYKGKPHDQVVEGAITDVSKATGNLLPEA